MLAVLKAGAYHNRMPAGWRPYDNVRFRGAQTNPSSDAVAVEEPLEVRIGHLPLAVLMRTPGDDQELTAGFLLTEGFVKSAADIQELRRCPGTSPEARENVIVALLRDASAIDPERLQRNLYASSSCGMCGKARIDQVRQSHPPIQDEVRVSREVLTVLPQRLRERQTGFDATGGLHAAGLFDRDGRTLCIREDVGRHNAVDKVIGWALLDGRVPLSAHLLQVSGRAGFEILQKALAARVPVVSSVSAPSSLAVDLARAANMTLASFVRGENLSVFSGEFRIAAGAGC